MSAISHHVRLSLGFSLVTLFLVGCAGVLKTPIVSAMPAHTVEPASEVKPELKKYFQGFTGGFVLYNLNTNQYIRYEPDRTAERLLPASTFKIMNALIGLDTGIIPDENFVINWDGTQYDDPAWNHDQTLKTALQGSVVWYFQELARRVGKEKILTYINAVGYGNKDLSGQVDSFWLRGGLKISSDEQIEFLKQLYQGHLPFSQRSMKIVKKIMIMEKDGIYTLSGKTGSGLMGARYIGRFVGYVEEKGNVYFFATNIESPRPDATGDKALEITHNILQSLGLLP